MASEGEQDGIDPPKEETTSTKKEDLMASLMGGAPATTEPTPATTVTSPAAAADSGSSLLEQSGLLTGGGGGGLFDDIDAEAEEERKKQEAAAATQRAKEEAEQEARRQAEQQQQQQQQNMQAQMQNMSLGGYPGQQQPIHPGMHQPMQQPIIPSQQNMGLGGMNGQPTGVIAGTPLGMSGSPQMRQQVAPGMTPTQQTQGMPSQMAPSLHSTIQQRPLQANPPHLAQQTQQMQPQQMQQPQMQQPMQQPSMQQAAMQQPVMQARYTSQQQNQPPAGFYRDHGSPAAPAPPAAQGFYGQQPKQPQHAHSAMQQPSYTAGMHNTTPHVLGRVPGIGGSLGSPIPPPQQQVSNVKLGQIVVSDPLLLQTGKGMMFGGAPHWSYQISTPNSQMMNWVVRRRFRHVVALEDRLREECPGGILPPRPDKHATRAIEEASRQQSVEFAMQRSAELAVYLNQLAQHPIAGSSPTLAFFLSLQDDLGIAWPEVSTNALTRLANASVGVAVKASEQVRQEEAEDNAELLALQSAESVRMGAVLQAVPKLEGAVTLLREHAEQSGVVGMEVSRVSKELAEPQPELDVLVSGLLRSSRRSKRLALELSAALHSFTFQYKTCRYERMAFSDRRAAIAKRAKQMGRHMYPQYGGGDDECSEIGRRLQSEVARITWQRKNEWSKSSKVIASAMKEASSERVAIWEGVLEQFDQTFPGYRQAMEPSPPPPPVVDTTHQAFHTSVDATSQLSEDPSATPQMPQVATSPAPQPL